MNTFALPADFAADEERRRLQALESADLANSYSARIVSAVVATFRQATANVLMQDGGLDHAHFCRAVAVLAANLVNSEIQILGRRCGMTIEEAHRMMANGVLVEIANVVAKSANETMVGFAADGKGGIRMKSLEP